MTVRLRVDTAAAVQGPRHRRSGRAGRGVRHPRPHRLDDMDRRGGRPCWQLLVGVVGFESTAPVGLLAIVASVLSLNGFAEDEYGRARLAPGRGPAG